MIENTTEKLRDVDRNTVSFLLTTDHLVRVNVSNNPRDTDWTVCVPEKLPCSSWGGSSSSSSAMMSGLHHHKQHPTTKMKRGGGTRGEGGLGRRYRHRNPSKRGAALPWQLSVGRRRRRRTTASLPSHIQHKYFSQAVETMAEMLKLVTSHCALV